MRDLYLKADSQYNGRVTVPLLWDKKHGMRCCAVPNPRLGRMLMGLETIVNNDSGEIARMFFGAFDKFLPSEKQEATKGEAAFIPKHLESDIDILNAWVFDNINNGVYKTGFATTQSAYNENVLRLFQGLDRLEYHLSQPGNAPYLFGEHITESDIRLFPTIIRFDAAYYTLFKCNMKMIRTDYPRLHDWVRNLYWNEGPETNGGVFQKTTNFDIVSILDSYSINTLMFRRRSSAAIHPSSLVGMVSSRLDQSQAYCRCDPFFSIVWRF
ncbi:glutathione S-transferase [Corynespora cassiicola Philippines]|uniref:Glutathione S-transferase n=1 Tax=Corynespora cassiicola Philippines TaxID=1448308 RepID=A0A2T2N305_CORCC|nr:glutathione S-transferase [Corynespora cassiicola Philippines]